VLLVLALAVAVHWRSRAPQTFSAELWSATPQVAAPRAAQSAAVAPPPAAPAPPPPPTPRVATPAPPPPAPDPQIAIDKARQQKLQADREAAERDKAQREKAEKAEKAEQDKQDKQRAEKLKAEKAEKAKDAERERRAAAKAEAEAKREQQEKRDRQAEEQRLAKQREDNLKRMLGQAGATGAPSSTGSALKDAAPSASYAGKLIARIKPNIVFTDSISGNPAADVEVRASASGTILARRLVKSSGHKDWDDAVLRAIDRTGELPRDVDGRVPPLIVITFTP
jgi:colicin import membrane protein